MAKRRIKLRLKRPNPLFERWLEEMRSSTDVERARAKYALALASLRKYPLALESGAECAILRGFGKKLCAELDRRLLEHCQNEREAENIVETPRPPPPKRPRVDVVVSLLDFDEAEGAPSRLAAPKFAPDPDEVILLDDDDDDDERPNSSPKDGVLMEDEEKRNASQTSITRMDIRIGGEYPIEDCPLRGLEISQNNVIIENGEREDVSVFYPSRVNVINDRSNSSEDPATNVSRNNSIQIREENEDIPLVDLSQTDDIDDRLNSAEDFPDVILGQKNVYDNNYSVNLDDLPDVVFEPKSIVQNRESPINVEDLPDIIADPVTTRKKLLDDDDLPNVNLSQGHVGTVKEHLTNDDSPGVNVSQTFSNFSSVDDDEDSVIFIPGSYDVILLADTAEITGFAKKHDPTKYALKKYATIRYELRSLKVGDFAWIARHRTSGLELVLPHVVERKRIDDLAKSIKDGRYHEQKFRLKNCGLPNVTYLIEKPEGVLRPTGLPVSSLMQAIFNTRIQDGFDVHFTTSLENSIRFLAMRTKNIVDEFGNKMLKKASKEALSSRSGSNHVRLMLFADFNSLSSKSKHTTINDMFIKQLLQLKGLSIEKALAIADKYKTPFNLISAYKCVDSKTGEKMLASLPTAKKSSFVGPSISKLLYQYFTSETLL